MYELANKIKTGDYKLLDNAFIISRLTALWAFSEAALGGFLHAFKIPFTGLFVGGTAVLFITLIANYSDKKSTILKSTMIVLLAKAAVSPHTPVTAYFAVSLQGFLGYLFFYNKNFFRISALLLGIFTLLTSALQKVIILTIVFGNTLWNSVNLFIDSLLQQFSVIQGSPGINFSIIIAGIYIGIHLLAGIIIGFTAGLIPNWINNMIFKGDINSFSSEKNDIFFPVNKREKKQRRKSPGIIIIFISTVFVIYSYFFPQFFSNRTAEIIVMFIRAVVIMFLWYAFISPFLLNIIRKYFRRKENQYSIHLDKIIKLFPHFNSLINRSWKSSSEKKGIKRFKFFLAYAFTFLLLLNIEE